MPKAGQWAQNRHYTTSSGTTWLLNPVYDVWVVLMTWVTPCSVSVLKRQMAQQMRSALDQIPASYEGQPLLI
jgi:hypothetical protein